MANEISNNREEYMLNWTTSKCKDGAVVTLEEGWSFIVKYGIDVLRSVLLGKSSLCKPLTATAFSCLYTVSFKMCSQPTALDYSLELYDRYKQTIENFLRDDIIPMLIREQHGLLLNEFCNSWRTHKLMTRWMWRLFMHLDSGVIQNKRSSEQFQFASLTSLSLRAFHDMVYCAVHSHIRNNILGVLESDREDEEISHEDVAEAVDVFRLMGAASTVYDAPNLTAALEHPTIWSVYIRDLEYYILEDTHKYYRLHGELCVSRSTDVSTYLLAVRDARDQEMERCCRYFPSRTTTLVSNILLHEMITKQQAFITDGIISYVESLFNEHFGGHIHNFGDLSFDLLSSEFSGLRNMYELFMMTAEAESLPEGLRENDIFLSKLVDGLNYLGRMLGDSVLVSNSFLRKGQHRSPADWIAQSPVRLPGSGTVQTPSSSRSVRLTVPGSTELSPFTTPKTPCGHGRGTTGGSSQKIKQACVKVTEDVILVVNLLDSIVQRILDGSMIFVKAVQKACKYAVNFDCEDVNCVDLYANYCNHMINTDALAQLDTFMKTIFSNIEAKDYFMDAYIGLLSKRLLGGKSVSYDTEKAVVAQMKMQCGTSFTIKVEGMIIDHSLAESIYKKWLENSTVDCKMINFHVQVLTSCYWPKLSSNSLRLSTEMQHCVDSFTDWYLTTNSSRRLRWVHSAGEVVIRATYFPPVGCGSSAVKASPPPSRVYEVCLTTEQCAVLRIFDQFREGSPGITTLEVKRRSGIEDVRVVKRVLHSLSCQNLKILSKSPSNTKLILETDLFCPNIDFNSRHRKFKISMPPHEEKSSERALEGERSHSVDAAIVRVMKARRVARHEELLQEVVRQICSFSPEMRFIKQRISILIEKCFIERDGDDSSLYRYMP